MKVTLSSSVTPEQIKAVEGFLDDLTLRDPNWNGFEFHIEIGEFTCVEGESLNSQILARSIFDLLNHNPVKTQIVKIVWNGCDGYVESDEAVRRGCDFVDGKVYKGYLSFREFEVVKVDPDSVPVDEDGELDTSGLYITETGNFYRMLPTEGSNQCQ